MPIEMSEIAGVYYFRMYGTITGPDLMKMLEEGESIEGQASTTPHRIVDTTKVEAWGIGFTEWKALAVKRKDAHLSRAVKAAFVAPRGIDKSISWMYQSVNQNPKVEVKIFPSMSEARAWIGES